uniref:EOG090X014D n=1 Tax=Alona affinis TaxID=381656 RepID=A0A9N6ZFR3_9CRUS|nr:EOG090X014D [Alona affinis]
MTYRPMVFHRQVQTESSHFEDRGLKQEEEPKQQSRKSIAVGDGAINDILCERCTNKRTRHAAVGTDPIRPLSGVSVATQSYETTCQECDARSKSRMVETVDREMQTTDSSSSNPNMSRIPLPIQRPLSHLLPKEADHPADFESSESERSSHESEGSDAGSEGSTEEEDDDEEALPPPEILQPRIRVEPSMEMKAALKVLNDSIHRPQRGSSKMLVSAIDIVRREWIQISSTKEADAHRVEDYMDYIETLSMALLERVANLSDNNGNTALHYAVSHSQWDIVSLLLDSKVCYPQLRNKAGYSPPMLAALAQPKNTTELQVLERLFSLADVNVKATQHGQTPLMLSVSHGRVEVCRLLLAAGANVNVQDADGSTALMCAAEHGHTPIVKLLLAQPDIDLQLKDNDGSTALTIAMEAGHKDIGLLIYAHLNFHRSNSSSAASSPVQPSASPIPSIKRKGSPLPIVQLHSLRPNDVDVRLLAHTHQLLQSLEAETGIDPGYIVNGGLFIASSKERLDEYKRLQTLGKAFGIESYVLGPEETKKLYPLMNVDDVYGTLFSPRDGVVDPAGFCTALTRAATRAGAKVIEDCVVTGIDTDNSNVFGSRQVRAVRTLKGTIKTNCVINCTGAWAPYVGAMVNVPVPLIVTKHAYVVTERIEGISGMPNVRDHDSSIYFKVQGDSLSVGGYENDPVFIDQSTVSGPESFTPDHKPLLGEEPTLRGFYHGCGFNSAGMMFGGGCGWQLAKWVVQGRPDLDMYGYDIRRFNPSLSRNSEWIRQRSHEAYAKNYSIVYPHDEPLASRKMIQSPVGPLLEQAGCVFQERHGWERPGWFSKSGPAALQPYDWYGAYDHKPSSDQAYVERLKEDYSFGFPRNHSVIEEECRAARQRVAMSKLPSAILYHPLVILFVQSVSYRRR